MRIGAECNSLPLTCCQSLFGGTPPNTSRFFYFLFWGDTPQPPPASSECSADWWFGSNLVFCIVQKKICRETWFDRRMTCF